MNRRLLSVCCLLLVLVLPCLTFAAPSDLDPSFGVGGIVTTPIGGHDAAHSVVIQPDGKLVVAGSSVATATAADFALLRYLPDGTLDPAFGTGGVVVTAIGSGEDAARGVALQADGRILAAGYSFNGSDFDLALARYLPDGTLDTSFGTGGIVVTPIGSGLDKGYSVAVQPDGGIVVGGYSHNGTNIDFALLRYLPDGSLDPTFGSGGVVVTPIGNGDDIGLRLALQPDGRIVLAGRATYGPNRFFAMARYLADGTLDATFGTAGVVVTAVGTSVDIGLDVTLLADGRLVMSGSSWNGTAYSLALVRYLADGSLDSTFGVGGIVTTAVGSDDANGRTVLAQPDGKLVLAGEVGSGNGWDLVVTRYYPDGSLDSSFGTGGIVVTPVGANYDYGYHAALQADGRIVVVGTSMNADYDVALVRYLGGTGVVTIPEAVDNTALAWTTGGSAPWAGQEQVFSFGYDAAQSGAIGDYQNSWVATTVTGPGELTFLWKVSSEAGYDLFKFEIDGAKQPGSISGERDWAQRTIVIPAGSHTLRWVYSKDESFAEWQDAAWLDKVIFTPLYSLDVAVSGPAGGIGVTVAPADYSSQGDGGTPFQRTYLEGASVTLTAPATAQGMLFRGWSGCDSATATACTVAMNANRTVTASYSPALLSVASVGTAATISVNPPGTSQTTPFSREYLLETPVTLTAPALSGIWTFDTWSGCDSASGTNCNVAMTADRTVTAAYLPPVILTVAIAGSGTGAVASTPAGIACGSDCSEEYALNTPVVLTATPDPSAIFLGWSGCDSTSGTSCTVTITTTKAVTASFHARPTVIAVLPPNGATGVPTTSPVTVTFSADMDPATITTGTVTVSQFVGVKQVAAGYGFTLVLKDDGSVVAWGDSQYGKTTIPDGLAGVTVIDASTYHSMALKSDGTVIAWGNNNSGQTNVPAGLTKVIAVAAGGKHSVALKNEGTVVAWGDNSFGQTTVPSGLTGVIAISSGTWHTVALKNDGTVVAWGGYAGVSSVPPGLTGVTAIAAGGAYTVALKNDGTVVAWGSNGSGQTNVPVGLTGVTAIAAGASHTVTLTNNGTVVAWGNNNSGQTNVPAGLTKVIAIAAGDGHTVALKNDGTIVALGLNDHGQATVPANLYFSQITGTVSYDIATRTATFTPDQPLPAGTNLTVAVNTGAMDTLGAPLQADFTSTFTTIPHNLTVTVEGNGTVASSPAGISCGSDCTENFPYVVPVTLTATPNPGAILLGWSGCDRTNGLTCTVTMNDSRAVTAIFHTLPTVTTVSPPANATAVPIDAPVTVTFSADMDPATITTETITVRKATLPLTGTVSYDSATRTATFTPAQPLSAGTNLTVTVNTGARDTAGAPLPGDITWDFTTVALRLSVNGQPYSYYSTLQAALAGAPAGHDLTCATLQAIFREELNVDRCTNVTISGSHDPTYTTILGPTEILGSVVVSCGILEITGGGLSIQ